MPWIRVFLKKTGNNTPFPNWTGRHQLCHTQGPQVQPGHPDLPPVEGPETGENYKNIEFIVTNILKVLFCGLFFNSSFFKTQMFHSVNCGQQVFLIQMLFCYRTRFWFFKYKFCGENTSELTFEFFLFFRSTASTFPARTTRRCSRRRCWRH